MAEVAAPAKVRSEPWSANEAGIFAVRGTPPIDAAGLEPPSEPQFDGPVQWERFLTFSGPLEGYIVAGRLDAEGVPTIVELDRLGFTFSSSVVWVPSHLVHRARWVLAWSAPSEAELTFLATGELDSTEDGGK